MLEFIKESGKLYKLYILSANRNTVLLTVHSMTKENSVLLKMFHIRMTGCYQ